MPGFNHVRWRFWYPERYTEAQAREFRRLRELYTTYLVPAFGPAMPDIFALRTDGDDYYPRYTATTLTPLLPLSAPPAASLGARPLKPFADALLTTLAVFEAGRAQRWLGKGHPNDPTRLLGLFIRQTCERWLTHAPLNETTLGQVTALRRYFESLARDRLFTNEGQDHGSLGVLLHNLGAPLTLLEKRLHQEIRLQSAREHFAEVKAQVGEALEEGARYLFHALAEHDRTALPFSFINLQTRVISGALSKALQTREGLLLKQWLYAPGLRRVLLPEQDQKHAALSDSAPISLLGSETPTPLLDEKGQANAVWVGFLTQQAALTQQLSLALREVPVGICPVLSDAGLVADAIRLHGLMETLAEYQFYVHQCWQLAGFGGDHCVYDQLVDAITSILGELRIFSQALREQLQTFQEKLDAGYRRALEASRHTGWQANYCKAKAAQEQWLALLQGGETHLERLLAQAGDRRARAERQGLAQQAYQTLRAAPHFLNRARQQVGLAPRPHYPGLAPSETAPPIAPSALADLRWDQVTALFLSTSPASAAWLGELCRHTPSTPPWRVFRGRYRRHCYLQDADRLKRLYQQIEQLQFSPASPLTPERKALIEQSQQQLREEQARIRQLQQGLWWPFHRASIRFFELWLQGVTQRLRGLDQWLQATLPVAGFSAQGVQQRLSEAPTASFLSTPGEGSVVIPARLTLSERKANHKTVPAEEKAFISTSVLEIVSSLPVVTSGLETLRAGLAESQARDQQMLAEIKERDQQALERLQQWGEEIMQRSRQEHEESVKQLQQGQVQREATAQALTQARLESVLHSHPELLRPGAPLAHARSPYFNFCWSDPSRSQGRYPR